MLSIFIVGVCIDCACGGGVTQTLECEEHQIPAEFTLFYLKIIQFAWWPN